MPSHDLPDIRQHLVRHHRTVAVLNRIEKLNDLAPLDLADLPGAQRWEHQALDCFLARACAAELRALPPEVILDHARERILGLDLLLAPLRQRIEPTCDIAENDAGLVASLSDLQLDAADLHALALASGVPVLDAK